MNKVAILALAGLMLAHQAGAAEVIGAEAGLEYSDFSSGSDDLDKSSAFGSLEVGFTDQLSIQGDLTFSRLGFVGADSQSLGLHAIYNVAPSVSLGIFAGKDWIEGGNATFYGIEAGGALDRIRGETYLGAIDDGDESYTQFGIRGDFAAYDFLTVGGRFDYVDADISELSRLSVTTAFTNGNFEITGELGRAHAEGENETFFGVGARMNFGQRPGTTFEKRGLISILPGL